MRSALHAIESIYIYIYHTLFLNSESREESTAFPPSRADVSDIGRDVYVRCKEWGTEPESRRHKKEKKLLLWCGWLIDNTQSYLDHVLIALAACRASAGDRSPCWHLSLLASPRFLACPPPTPVHFAPHLSPITPVPFH